MATAPTQQRLRMSFDEYIDWDDSEYELPVEWVRGEVVELAASKFASVGN